MAQSKRTGRRPAREQEWDEELAIRPEHFAAGTVYPTCVFSKGGYVSEMRVYGLAQDVSGFLPMKRLRKMSAGF